MSPARKQALRVAGVLDGTKLDLARIAFLDIYESARGHRREPPTAERLRVEVALALDPVMRGTDRQQGVLLAQRAVKRRRA